MFGLFMLFELLMDPVELIPVDEVLLLSITTCRLGHAVQMTRYLNNTSCACRSWLTARKEVNYAFNPVCCCLAWPKGCVRYAIMQATTCYRLEFNDKVECNESLLMLSLRVGETGVLWSCQLHASWAATAKSSFTSEWLSEATHLCRLAWLRP